MYSSGLSTASADLISIYSCYSLDSTDGANSVQFDSQNVSLSNANFSHNYAALRTSSAWNAADVSSKWAYATIYNNIDAEGATLNSRGAASSYIYYEVNLIQNVPQDEYGLLYLNDYATAVVFSSCIFSGNIHL